MTYRLLFLMVGVLFSVFAKADVGERSFSLDGFWSFRMDPYSEGVENKWYAENYRPDGWDALPVPGNWELRNEYESYVGLGWYRKTFPTPEGIREKEAYLRFEAVSVHYTVWLNGRKLGTVTGGYFPHKFNVTSLLKTQGENVVTVCVDNNLRTGAYWSWGGIRRPVTLLILPKEHIERVRICAEPDLESGKAVIEAQTYFSTELPADCSIVYEIEKDGRTILQKKVQNATATVRLPLSKKQVKLWHFDHPELYNLHVSLMKGKVCVHRVSERFGIRKITWDNKRFYLNGEPVRLLGLNWVADDRFTGNTLPPEVYKAHIDDMRRMGAVMARLSHVPLPEDVLDYLDEVGMLVIDEIPVWGDTHFAEPGNEVSFSWLKQMVENHYNHPCIVGWSVGNEIGNQIRNPQVTPYVKSAIEYVKTMDQSRPAMDVSNTAAYSKNDPSQYSDIYALNCYSKGTYGKNPKKVVAQYGERPLFMSEFGCELISEDLNSDFDQETAALNEMRGIDFFFGAALWTYNDYRSKHLSTTPESTWNTPLSENRAWGLVDAYGRHKRAYRQARKEYAPLKRWEISGQNGNYAIRLIPRGELDLPAYILDGYTLEMKSYTQTGEVVESTAVKLPRIKPGDAPLDKKWEWENAPAAYCKVALVNPQGIELMDTAWYHSFPEKPVIKDYRAAKGKLRLYLQPVPGATDYWATCEEIGSKRMLHSDTVALPTLIDMGKVYHKKKYKVTLYARNNRGISVSEPVVIEGSEDSELPPEVKKIQALPAFRSIGIGYGCNRMEYLYEVEYAESPDMKSNPRRVFTEAKGACFIPKLEVGKTYYVRMRMYFQYQQESEWSPVYEVTL